MPEQSSAHSAANSAFLRAIKACNQWSVTLEHDCKSGGKKVIDRLFSIHKLQILLLV